MTAASLTRQRPALCSLTNLYQREHILPEGVRERSVPADAKPDPTMELHSIRSFDIASLMCRRKRSALAGLILFGALGGSAEAQRPDWMFGPFEKPRQVNPIIAPNEAATFFSPMSDSVVRWEEL